MKPSENCGEDETLPGLEVNELPSKLFALDMRAEFDEFTDALCRFEIEDERELGIAAFCAREIVDLALAGEASPLASRDTAGENVIAISTSDSNVWVGIYWVERG